MINSNLQDSDKDKSFNLKIVNSGDQQDVIINNEDNIPIEFLFSNNLLQKNFLMKILPNNDKLVFIMSPEENMSIIWKGYYIDNSSNSRQDSTVTNTNNTPNSNTEEKQQQISSIDYVNINNINFIKNINKVNNSIIENTDSISCRSLFFLIKKDLDNGIDSLKINFSLIQIISNGDEYQSLNPSINATLIVSSNSNSNSNSNSRCNCTIEIVLTPNITKENINEYLYFSSNCISNALYKTMWETNKGKLVPNKIDNYYYLTSETYRKLFNYFSKEIRKLDKTETKDINYSTIDNSKNNESSSILNINKLDCNSSLDDSSENNKKDNCFVYKRNKVNSDINSLNRIMFHDFNCGM